MVSESNIKECFVECCQEAIHFHQPDGSQSPVSYAVSNLDADISMKADGTIQKGT